MDLLLEHEDTSLGVVVPRRSTAEIVRSRAQLGHGARYVKDGKDMFRGVGWIYTPNSPLALLAPIKGDAELTPIELLSGYVLNTHHVAGCIVEESTTRADLTCCALDMASFNDIGQIKQMLEAFGLSYAEERLQKVVSGGKVNVRQEEKDRKAVDVPVQLAYYERALAWYQGELTRVTQLTSVRPHV